MERGVLLLKASGGLANRLQVVAAGVAYCLLHDRALYVDWRDGIYSDDSSNVFPLWFDLRGVPTVDSEEEALSLKDDLYPPFWRNWLREPVAVEYLFDNNHMSPENVAMTSIDFAKPDYPQSAVIGWGWNMTPALLLAPLLRQKFPGVFGESDRETLRIIFRNYIVLKDELQKAVNDFAVEHFTPGRTIGAHIRQTDLKSPLEASIKAIRDTADPEDTIFITTDNIRVQKSVERIFPRVVYTDKAFPAIAGETLHGFTQGISRVRKGREALIDMYLLARCDKIVHFSRSSFARIPAILSGLCEERIKIVF